MENCCLVQISGNDPQMKKLSHREFFDFKDGKSTLTSSGVFISPEYILTRQDKRNLQKEEVFIYLFILNLVFGHRN